MADDTSGMSVKERMALFNKKKDPAPTPITPVHKLSSNTIAKKDASSTSVAVPSSTPPPVPTVRSPISVPLAPPPPVPVSSTSPVNTNNISALPTNSSPSVPSLAMPVSTPPPVPCAPPAESPKSTSSLKDRIAQMNSASSNSSSPRTPQHSAPAPNRLSLPATPPPPVPTQAPSSSSSGGVASVTSASPAAADTASPTAERRHSVKDMLNKLRSPSEDAAPTATPEKTTAEVDRRSSRISHLGQSINLAALMGASPPQPPKKPATPSASEDSSNSSSSSISTETGNEAEFTHLSLSRPTTNSSRRKQTKSTEINKDMLLSIE